MERANSQIASPCVPCWHEETLHFAGMGTCRCTLDGTIVHIDGNALEALGIRDGETLCEAWIGQPFASLTPEVSVSFPGIGALAREPWVREVEIRLTAQGPVRWLRLHMYVALDTGRGQPIVTVLIQDISAERRTQEALRESEQRFRLLAENIPGVIYLCKNDPRYTMLYVNDHIETVTGYAKERFLEDKLCLADVFHPEDAARIRASVDAGLDRQRPFHMVYRVRHRSGEWRWIEEHGTGVFDEDSGELLFLEGFLSDITERQRAEAALQESEQRYRFLAQNSADLIARLDQHGRFVYVSPASSALLGYAPDAMSQRTACEFAHPDEIGMFRAFYAKLRHHTGRYRIEHRIRHAEGAYPWMETVLHVMQEAPDHPWEIIAVMRDVTERRRLRQEIEQHAENLEELVAQRTARVRELEAQRADMEKLAAAGRMAAGVAHEINNPLTGLRNCLLIMAKSIPADHPDRQFADLAQREIERISRIVRQMYQLYRPEADIPSRVDIGAEMRDVCLMLERRFEKQGLDVRVHVPEHLPAPVVPAGYLRQILYNLLINAVDASSDNSQIEFCARDAGEGIEIDVADHGLGIPDEILPCIFEPFFTTKRHHDGSGMGLGLSVSRSLAAAMNGELRVASRAGGGAVFTLVLPHKTAVDGQNRIEP